jgi:hypothetical protein
MRVNKYYMSCPDFVAEDSIVGFIYVYPTTLRTHSNDLTPQPRLMHLPASSLCILPVILQYKTRRGYTASEECFLEDESEDRANRG